MSSRDRLLGLLVALLWGLNFLALDYGLRHFPPLFFAGLRYAVLLIPTLLFVPWPRVEWKWLLGYGLGLGTLQFAFMFIALDMGMPTGLAALVLQASAPFTVLLGVLLLGERITPIHAGGIVLAVLGMIVISWHRAQTAALLPVILTLLGALSWAFGNLCVRKANPPNPLHLTMWISIVPPLPMFALSALSEGPWTGWQAIGTAFSTGQGWWALAGLTYTAIIATVIGSSVWTTLMRRHPAGTVAPFALLVPVVGMTAAWLVLGEQPHPVELLAGVVIVGGVLLSSISTRPAPAAPPDQPTSGSFARSKSGFHT